MAEDLSAVQNSVELRISDTPSDRQSLSTSVLTKLAAAMMGCAALASCATRPIALNQSAAPVAVAAAGTSDVAAPPAMDKTAQPPSGLSTRFVLPPARSKSGADKPASVVVKRVPAAGNAKFTQVGLASWYGADFHGRKTADGERFDMMGLTAAHRSMPLPSYARVTNMSNGTSIVVRVNDRGPYAHGRLIDLSSRAADLLQFKSAGVGKVKIEYVGRAPEKPGDTKMLLATLRTDGSPAPLPGNLAPSTMIAEALPQAGEDTVAQSPVSISRPSVGSIPMVKPSPVPALAQMAQPVRAVPAPQAVALNAPVLTPLPPERPRSSDGVLGESAGGSVGQYTLAKSRVPLPPQQPAAYAQPNAPGDPLPVVIPSPAMNASMTGQ